MKQYARLEVMCIGRSNSPIYLGIDSSSPYLALALWSREGVLAYFCEAVGRAHAARISGALDNLFRQAKVSRSDLAGVGVGTGPGSYTGLKIGVAIAQGLAQGLGVEMRGESSLAAMAATCLTPAVPKGIVALDARRGNVYAGVFERTEGRIHHGPLEKLGRDALQRRHPTLPYFENVEPDATYFAERVADAGAGPATPLYL